MRVEGAVRATLMLVDGSATAALPERSGSPPLVAGPAAWFVAGRVSAEAPTNVCISDEPALASDLAAGRLRIAAGDQTASSA